MNKKFILHIAFIVLLLSGCSENYLETKPEGSLTVNSFFNSPEDIRMVTRSMYGRDWFNYLDKASTCIGELLPGNALSKDGVYLPFANGTLSSGEGQLGAAWGTFYGIITRANQCLRNIKDLETAPASSMEEAKNITIGECRFFRAYAYYLLVNYWGAVPIVLDNAAEYVDIKRKRNVSDDIYELVVRDLTDAIAKLPAKATQPYLTKLSAKALLAKVYLTKAGTNFGSATDFTKAKDLAKEILDNSASAGYGLMSKYHDLWLIANNNNKETLFAWQWDFSSAFADWGIQNSLQSYYAPSDFTGSWDGWSAVVPSIDMIESWEAGDLRRYSSMMENGNKYTEFWKDQGGYTYNAYTCNYGGATPSLSSIRKHLAGKDNSSDGKIAEMHTNVYTPLIRLADVYLTYAEAVLAKNAVSSDAVALGYINVIRNRAGLAPKSSFTYKELFNERRHEFAFEFVNWDDMLRYYRLYPQEVKTMLMNQERGSYNVDANKNKTLVTLKLPSVTDGYFVLPIPAGETLIDPALLDEPVKFDFNNYF